MPNEFSLVSWNVLADVHITDDWYPGIAAEDLRGPLRRQRVVDHLLAMDADVMALQEVQPQLLDDLKAAFPDHGVAFVSRVGEGLATLVRGVQPWSRVLPVPGRTPRALQVHLPGGVRLVNVHLKWTGDPRPRQSRAGVDQLKAILDYAPDLVAGDFNAFPTWPERQLATERGYRELGPEGPTCTVHQRLQPLDALLGRDGWQAETTPLPVVHAHTPMPSPVHPSDHLPLHVRLRRTSS